MHLTDSHLHLTEPGIWEKYPDLGSLEHVFSCTALPDEWSDQRNMDMKGLKRFYGVHPWYADQWNTDVEKMLVKYLTYDPSAGVGEIGVDSKKGDPVLQIPVLERQLEIASEMCRTVTIHMTGMEKQLLDSLRKHHKGIPATILHSFKSESYVKPFSELGCYFSLSPRLLDRSEDRLKSLLDRIPEDKILIETDAPHTGKNFESMGKLMERFAGIKGTTVESFTETVYWNMERIA